MERRTSKPKSHEDVITRMRTFEQHPLFVDEKPEKSDTAEVGLSGKETVNIALLYFLYVLQGIPLGLGGSIPMVLQNRNVSYKEQAIFSFVNWPFSMKLLWAPIVDSVYSSHLGRRKTWLVPTQYLIGLCMLLLSLSVSSLLGDEAEHSQPNVFLLTVGFFVLNFLAATQDIAVDGWALTMLSRRNVGYASTCNSVGQTTGFFLGNVMFLALESSDFCNKYLRTVPQQEGIVTLSSFLYIWGIIFFITTTLVWIFKKETVTSDEGSHGIIQTYRHLFHIACLPHMWTMVALLLTCKIGFAATDAATGLKLIEAGVHKEHLALLAIPMVPLQILLPLVISRYTAGPRPLIPFLKAYPYRLLFGPVFAVLVGWTHSVKLESGAFPTYYYAVILLFYAIHQVTVYAIFVSLMAFFAQVSDPSIGGTYMTLLNTLCNLGGTWTTTLALWMIDLLTFKVCENAPSLSCDTKELALECEQTGRRCVTSVDGYYLETAFCVMFGFMWLRWGRSAARQLQSLPHSAWTHS